MNIKKTKEDNGLTKIFDLADKLGVSTEETIDLIEHLRKQVYQLERVGLNASAAGIALRKALKNLTNNEGTKDANKK